MMGRTYYTVFEVSNKADLITKVNELREAGEVITEVCTRLGTQIYI